MGNTTGQKIISEFCDHLDSRMEALSDGGKTRFRIRIAGKVIEIRAADSNLADLFLRYMSCEEIGDDITPDAVFNCWKDDCARFAPSNSSDCTGAWLFRRDEGFIELTLPRGELIAVDYGNGRYYFCVDHEADTEPDRYNHPIPELFALWALNNSMIMLHSACVGISGNGVLLAARDRSGKSTLAISCLAEGFEFVGDDYILITREGQLKAMPLYRSVGLNPDMWKRIQPDMPVLRVDRNRGGKLLLNASGYPFREELLVRALIYPVITGLEEPEIRKVKPGPILARIIHSTVQQLGFFRDPEPYRIMSNRLIDLPVFELRLSTDLKKNTKMLREFISKEK